MVASTTAMPTIPYGAIDPQIQMMLARRELLGISSQELKQIAITWIEQGHDCPSLHELAWEPILSRHEAEHLFVKSLTTLGFQTPSMKEAADFLLRHHLSQIVAGIIAPEEGLHAMMEEAYCPEMLRDKFGEHDCGLRELIGCYWEYEDLHSAIALNTPGLDGQACLKALNEDVKRFAAE